MSDVTFVQLDENNRVIERIVIAKVFQDRGQDYINNTLNLQGKWVLATKNSYFGAFWDEENNCFIPTQPFPSWSFNFETQDWEPPFLPPTDDKPNWIWNEEKQDWDSVQEFLANLEQGETNE